MVKIRHAIYFKDSQTGREPAKEWIDSMSDRFGQARILTRIERAESGNFGDHKSVGEGVLELRVDVGPGYRVYYAIDGDELILLLFAGSKGSQSRDIDLAKQYWKQHKVGE